MEYCSAIKNEILPSATTKMDLGGIRVAHGEGNGNSLQCPCLENPTDVGAWGAAVSGVAQSWTQLKRLSSSSSRITRKDRETGKERESTLFSKESANTPISHLNHPTHIKTLEIMRMRFKIPLLRHFFKLG